MTSKNKQQGFLSLDMAIGLLVFGVVVTLAMVWQIKQMDAQDYRIAADQQRTISESRPSKARCVEKPPTIIAKDVSDLTVSNAECAGKGTRFPACIAECAS